MPSNRSKRNEAGRNVRFTQLTGGWWLVALVTFEQIEKARTWPNATIPTKTDGDGNAYVA